MMSSGSASLIIVMSPFEIYSLVFSEDESNSSYFVIKEKSPVSTSEVDVIVM